MRSFNRSIVESTPTIDTAIYASGDQLGGVNELTNISPEGKTAILLENIVILDKAKQSSALDILFFREAPTLISADNATLNISDSDMEKCIGVMKIAAADYSTVSGSSVASVSLTRILQPVAKSKSIYYVLVSRGTPTYGSTSDLVLKFGVNIP